jgi:hypothetical protein
MNEGEEGEMGIERYRDTKVEMDEGHSVTFYVSSI